MYDNESRKKVMLFFLFTSIDLVHKSTYVKMSVREWRCRIMLDFFIGVTKNYLHENEIERFITSYVNVNCLDYEMKLWVNIILNMSGFFQTSYLSKKKSIHSGNYSSVFSLFLATNLHLSGVYNEKPACFHTRCIPVVKSEFPVILVETKLRTLRIYCNHVLLCFTLLYKGSQ